MLGTCDVTLEQCLTLDTTADCMSEMMTHGCVQSVSLNFFHYCIYLKFSKILCCLIF